MTIQEARKHDQQFRRVTSTTDIHGITALYDGRVEILNDKELQVVGQAETNGISLGDVQPHKRSIQFVAEMIPIQPPFRKMGIYHVERVGDSKLKTEMDWKHAQVRKRIPDAEMVWLQSAETFLGFQFTSMTASDSELKQAYEA